MVRQTSLYLISICEFLVNMSNISQISHDPPLLTVSLTLSKRRPKDTRENIKATKQFTVSIISEPFVEAANSCAVEAPAHVDEWVVSGLTPQSSVGSLSDSS